MQGKLIAESALNMIRVKIVSENHDKDSRIGLDWNIYLTELQSIVLYYDNNKQPQLQDPWNKPLALVIDSRGIA